MPTYIYGLTYRNICILAGGRILNCFSPRLVIQQGYYFTHYYKNGKIHVFSVLIIYIASACIWIYYVCVFMSYRNLYIIYLCIHIYLFVMSSKVNSLNFLLFIFRVIFCFIWLDKFDRSVYQSCHSNLYFGWENYLKKSLNQFCL